MDAAAQAIAIEPPLVSIIMSVYNGEAFLQQAIDSILHQTYQHIQFIIVDDCSNEATRNILTSIKDVRVEIIYNIANLGLTKNLNAALNYCKGKYIARMDADDISLPDRIEKQVAFLEHYNHLAGTAGWIELIDEKGNATGVWDDDRLYNSEKELEAILPQKNVIAHPTVMLRTDIIQRFRYNEDQKHSQDWDLWWRLFACGLVIRKIKEVVLQYRVHSSSVTSTQKKKSVFKKMNETYYNYILHVLYSDYGDPEWNAFRKAVRKQYKKNLLKLFLSNIKRIFIK